MSYAVMPEIRFIGRNDDTEELYRLEAKSVAVIKQMAEELRLLNDQEPDALWTHALPLAVASAAESFSPTVSVAAALCLLKYHGFDISGVTKSQPGSFGCWLEVVNNAVIMVSKEPA